VAGRIDAVPRLGGTPAQGQALTLPAPCCESANIARVRAQGKSSILAKPDLFDIISLIKSTREGE